MNDWFASDHHYFHRKIITFCGRPFKDVDDMRERMIADHNRVVAPGDRVWLVGDFSFGEPDETSSVLVRLNGQKFLIKGNHDHQRRINGVKGYADVFPYKELKFGDDHIILSHFPFLVWNRAHHGSYHFHGHSHGNLQYPAPLINARVFDVGVDHLYRLNGNYSPVSWDWLKQRLAGRAFVPLDHHGEDHGNHQVPSSPGQ